MAFQTSAGAVVVIKRQTALGNVPAGTGGDTLRVTDSPGFDPDRAQIRSQENRADMLEATPRAGAKSAPGTFNGELTVGGAMDILWEAIQRGTWSAALVITEATGSAGAMTIAASGSAWTLTRTGGSWITDGLRVGDVVTLSNKAVSANNNVRLRVTTLTALVATVVAPPGSAFTTEASDAAWTLTRLKKVVNPSVPVEYYHVVEQHEQSIDLTQLFSDAVLTGLNLSLRPNDTVKWSATFTALNWQDLTAGSSPYFTAPAITTGLALIDTDSAVRYNGTDMGIITGFDLNFAINASAPPVVGSVNAPDVARNRLSITGTVTLMRQDGTFQALWANETLFEVSLLFTEPGTDPDPCLGIFIPAAKLTKVGFPFGGGEGFKPETHNITATPKVAASGYDATAVAIYSSAP